MLAYENKCLMDFLTSAIEILFRNSSEQCAVFLFIIHNKVLSYLAKIQFFRWTRYPTQTNALGIFKVYYFTFNICL